MNKKSFLHTASGFIFLLLLLGAGVSLAWAEEDEWESLQITLGLENPTFSKDGYTVEALEFDGYGMVVLRVSESGTVLGDVALENNSSGWSYLDNKKLRLKAGNVTDQEKLPMFGSLYSPRAELIFETKEPEEETAALELDLEADEEEYFLDEEVSIEMELRNTGEVKVDQIRLEVDSDGLVIREAVPQRFILDTGAKKTADLKFRFPDRIKKSYLVTVRASWTDSSGEHFTSETVEIKVEEPLEVYKFANSETFTGKTLYVTVSVKNIQKRTVKVRFFDALPGTFTFIEDSDTDEESALNREFVLAPDERRVFSYCISSEQPGAYRVPEAHAYVQLSGQAYAISSGSEDDENDIIRVYRRISYRDYKADKKAEEPAPEPDQGEEKNSTEVKLRVTIREVS
ncbi:hypothetical protein FTO70_08990 [Methanosarcina sp. KYL-1]|uniref:hypothetical protein n=1 Tax=Methanosarcina sp. KYL-1 TaxID=2602068 RepID=UPI0021013640|nr:hypothetical protein [Methanosarcina sp. KYL-1]MCQ1535809.1 hypothetical protein [Methanosarcina sp. KYL-1]